LENQDVDGRITYKMNLEKHGKVFTALIWLKIGTKLGKGSSGSNNEPTGLRRFLDWLSNC
jgi:hypothetical protein